MTLRIGVVGAGAVGSIVGGLLTKAGYDVTLIDQWAEHVEAMKQRGLKLGGPGSEETIRVRALHLCELQRLTDPFGAVFIAVKAYDTEWATHLAAGYLDRRDGLVVDFQNGVNDLRVAAIAGKERTLGCVILLGAALAGPGHAKRTDAGRLGFKVGELDGADTPRARALVALLGHVAPTTLTTNLWGERWSKLTLNCMANPLAGLSGLGTADVRLDAGTRRLAIHLAAEVITVGRALGYEVEPIWGIAPQRFVDAAAGRGLAEVEDDISRDAKSRGSGRPSMLQDVLRSRRTEIDYLNGYVVAEGRKVGVETPFNAAVVRLFHERGLDFSPDPGHLAPLLAMLPPGSLTVGSTPRPSGA
jgi:2-dehydropantoate 2-reductase